MTSFQLSSSGIAQECHWEVPSVTLDMIIKHRCFWSSSSYICSSVLKSKRLWPWENGSISENLRTSYFVSVSGSSLRFFIITLGWWHDEVFLLQNIAMAFGGLETPPGIFSGMEVRKKLYLPSSLHFLASASRSNNSPSHFCQRWVLKMPLLCPRIINWEKLSTYQSDIPNPPISIHACSLLQA
jgi:hypothetical protein